MRLSHIPTSLALCLIAASLQSQVAVQPTISLKPQLQLNRAMKADVLPAGKTQGQFYLTGFVREDHTIVLRWANDQGEMPTEGVRIFRQSAKNNEWKEITKKPVGFLQGKAAEKRLSKMPREDREKLLAYPFGNVQHDSSTRLRQLDLRPVGLREADDLTPEKSLKQFRTLRAAGKLNRKDLQMMHMRADMDVAMAETLGLTYTDDPGRGQWRYKVVVGLLEGGSVEVVCLKTFNPAEPTPIPQPGNLTATSGNGEVLLNWDQPSSDAISGFNVYRSEKEGGPWKRLNTDPVKHVELDLEEPETTVRRSLSIQRTMERMLKPLPSAARTPQKINEAYLKAVESSQETATLPTLSPATSKAIKAAVSAGRLRPGGVQAPRSLFTDSRRTVGNALQNEKTYYYKVTSLDILGGEQPMGTAPVAPGIPKDLDPPQVPGRPCLKAEAAARSELRTVQATRVKEPRLVSLDQSTSALAAKTQASAPFQLHPTPQVSPVQTPGKLPQANLTQREIRHKRLSTLAATLPVGALKKLGEAAVIHSNPDGSVPPAQVTWSPSLDSDLQAYQVHRATGDAPFTKVAEVGVPEWTDTRLSVGQAYRYAISSMDKLGNVSALSPVGKVEVSDSGLPGRLAVSSLKGQGSASAPTFPSNRRLTRPLNLALASGTLGSTKSKLLFNKTESPVLADFQAPKLSGTPRMKARTAMVSTRKVSLAKEVTATPTLQASSNALSEALQPSFRVIRRSFNPMMLPLAQPKEVYVLLEWGKPLQGFPLDYELQQAPQRMELVSTLRPNLAFQSSIKAFQAMSTTPVAVQSELGPIKTFSTSLPGAESRHGFVASTPALHAVAAQGIVATHGQGLKLSAMAKDFRRSLVQKEGPGVFSKVNETPIIQERYVLTFPAEVAQYGGATFYYRLQAFTKEFDRRVAGPVSAPIEVRVPDIVPPPSPAAGAADLCETAAGSPDLDTVLTWTQADVKDLVGVVVDRQPMNYKLVEGEAQADTPAGPAVRITSSPLKTLTFRDKLPPRGFQRYTLRSVDTTGNISEAIGSLDILVPGEPIPGVPGHLALSGNQLTWEAASQAAGYTVWRSFTGREDDYVCISGILSASATSFELPAEGKLHLRVVARSTSGMNTTPSAPLVRTP